jgi:hypothetical protein
VVHFVTNKNITQTPFHSLQVNMLWCKWSCDKFSRAKIEVTLQLVFILPLLEEGFAQEAIIIL